LAPSLTRPLHAAALAISLIYVPQLPGSPSTRNADNPAKMRSPREWGMPYEDVRIVTTDGVALHGWYIPAPAAAGGDTGDTAATLIFFHGNAGNIGIRLPNIYELHSKLSCAVLAIDYRGYGESERGNGPCERGLNLDADAALAWLLSREDVDRSKIFLFGRSLGGAVAIALAARALPICGIILENTFTRMIDVAVQVMLPLRLLPREFLHERVLRSRWDSRAAIQEGRVRAPLLFVSGLADELVPSTQMRQLFNMACEVAAKAGEGSAKHEIVTFATGTHNETFNAPGYYAALARFVHEQCKIREQRDLGSLNDVD